MTFDIYILYLTLKFIELLPLFSPTEYNCGFHLENTTCNFSKQRCVIYVGEKLNNTMCNCVVLATKKQKGCNNKLVWRCQYFLFNDDIKPIL